jgi:AraC-like DNA-binding protein
MDNLQFLGAGIASYPAGATLGPRLNESFEFVWIVKGTAVARFDEAEVNAPAGTLLLCRAGMHDYYRWDPSHTTIHGFFHFQASPALLRALPDQSLWPLSRSLDASPLFRPLCQQVLDYARVPGDVLAELVVPCAEMVLRQFIHLERLSETLPGSRFSAPVEKAMHAMYGLSLQSPIPLAPLSRFARSANVCAGHLCALFRKETDLSPLEYFRDMRLDRAEWLLKNSNLSIKEVAAATGFASQYHFSRCCKQRFGASPRAHRRGSVGRAEAR